MWHFDDIEYDILMTWNMTFWWPGIWKFDDIEYDILMTGNMTFWWHFVLKSAVCKVIKSTFWAQVSQLEQVEAGTDVEMGWAPK